LEQNPPTSAPLGPNPTTQAPFRIKPNTSASFGENSTTKAAFAANLTTSAPVGANQTTKTPITQTGAASSIKVVILKDVGGSINVIDSKGHDNSTNVKVIGQSPINSTETSTAQNASIADIRAANSTGSGNSTTLSPVSNAAATNSTGVGNSTIVASHPTASNSSVATNTTVQNATVIASKAEGQNTGISSFDAFFGIGISTTTSHGVGNVQSTTTQSTNTPASTIKHSSDSMTQNSGYFGDYNMSDYIPFYTRRVWLCTARDQHFDGTSFIAGMLAAFGIVALTCCLSSLLCPKKPRKNEYEEFPKTMP